MSECVMLTASAKIPIGKKMQFQLPINKTFCPTPPPLIHQRFKHTQKIKINKALLYVSPSSVFHTKFTISVLKNK